MPKERAQYKKNVRIVKNILSGKGKTIIGKLAKEMAALSKKQRYEKAAEARDRLCAIQNIFSHRHVIRRQDDTYAHKGLSYLKNLLKLSRLPQRIEAYDISNIHGKNAVGAMVVFTDGKPDKNEYRKFNIRLPHRPNDTAMIREIIERRLNNDWRMPNVIVIDGGKTQLNATLRVMSYALLVKRKIKVVALAKREEELYLPNGKVVALKKGPPALLHLLQYLRNEAHRFAVSFHRKKRRGNF
ncbi:MAG: UvrB/UvrC motif-containing protein [Candidatus Niyogibacteria bacterium]|nr:UvrB/UvrC motif-containing protein [Candidatus Niyogibacteria bacterium]